MAALEQTPQHHSDVQKLEAHRFRGHSPQNGLRRVFGGQVAAQAIAAAGRTVEARERLPHALQAQLIFFLPGDPKVANYV